MNYDRIILELIGRVAALEDEVQKLKSAQINDIEESDSDDLVVEGATVSTGRDTTKYIFEGKKYGKNRLVLAIVKKYMGDNPETSANELIRIFDKSLQGSLGVVQKLADAKQNTTDYKTRFFALPIEVIKTSTDDCVVCNQWGIANIGNMIARANHLGYEITIVKS